MVKIKVCGLTNIEDVSVCTDLKVDFLGFVFAKSPRSMTKEKVKRILDALPERPKTTGVFVNEKKEIVEEIANFCNFDVLQFHGNEKPGYCLHFMEHRNVFKAFRIRNETDLIPIPSYKVSAYLLDTFTKGVYGGTGKTFDWELAVKAKTFGCPIVLSGGLNVENVADAIKKVQPEIVDVSSGVETTPGKKDPEKLKKFIENVRNI